MPTFGLKHLFIKFPLIVYKPAIANTPKKNNNIMIVSLSKGIADNRATIKTLRPSILEIVLRGLKTLKDLRAFNLTSPVLAKKIDTVIWIIITKSRMFHGSLRYEFLFRTKPKPNTLRKNSEK